MLPWQVDPAQVLITTGSQQGLDLVAKVLIDAGAKLLVESPTYLGAVMAFTPMEPSIVSVATDDEGVDIDDVRAKADGARFLYVLPNFQNPTGRTMSEARRAALVKCAAAQGLPLLEDNPYGDLWFDTPPPLGLTARNPEGGIYMGSFSKVLAPGLRLGFVVAPKAVYPKLLQAKQAADLHTPGFNQRIVSEVMKDGFLDRHVPTIRALYKAQRDAMLEALARELPARPRPERRRARGVEQAGRRHVPVGAPAQGHERGGPAAQGGRAWRGLRAGRTVLCRPRRHAHAAAVLRDPQRGGNPPRRGRAGAGHPGPRRRTASLRAGGVTSPQPRRTGLDTKHARRTPPTHANCSDFP